MSPVMNECIPYYEPGSRISVWSENDLRAKRFVQVSADAGKRVDGDNIKVEETTGTAAVLGVVTFDAPVNSKGRAFSTVIGWGVVPVIAGTALTAGTPVASGPAGTAVAAAATGDAVGLVVSDCASGEDAQVRLTI